jgi:hypothetical protein
MYLVGGLGIQCALTFAARRYSGRWLSLTVMFCILWVLYYGVRGVMIVAAPTAYTHADVLASGYGGVETATVWATIGLACFVGGAWLVSRTRLVPHVPLNIRRNALLGIAVVGLLAQLATRYSTIASGTLVSVGGLSLFAVAALFALDSRHRLRLSSTIMLGATLSVGIASNFKEAAILPVIAAGIGWLGSGTRRVRPRTVLILAALAVFGYFTVAGMRISDQYQDDATVFTAAYRAFATYDLEGGLPDRQGSGVSNAVTDIVSSTSRRFGGMDSFIVIDSKLSTGGERVGWVSLTDPLLSLVPFTSTDPRFSSLSSGRFFAINYWSARPSTDPSSQAITIIGDLYLALGPAAIMIGMLLFGGLVRLIDTTLKPTTPFAAGAFVYLGLPLLGLERNIDYVLAATALRTITLSVVILLFANGPKRKSQLLDDGSTSDANSSSVATERG